MHLVMQHILSIFLHNIKHVLSEERDIIIHVILNKNKTRHRIIIIKNWKENNKNLKENMSTNN